MRRSPPGATVAQSTSAGYIVRLARNARGELSAAPRDRIAVQTYGHYNFVRFV
jgi:hypothetical protein